MPQVQSVSSPLTVRAEIQRASARTGVDFDYLLGQASLESSLDPSARASTSSASGLYQFINSTWLDTLQKHGGKHGLEWAAAQIETGSKGPVVRDPAARRQILALRFNPQVASLMAGEFANDNRTTIQAAIGREPNSTDLYLAHFLGPAGAASFLKNADRDPGLNAASLFPNAAAANRSIFYDRGGDARSLSEVYGLLETKMARAIERNGGTADPGFPGFNGLTDFASVSPEMAEFETAAAEFGGLPPSMMPPAPPPSVHRAGGMQIAVANAPAPAPRASMAETLRASFGLNTGSDDAASANVRKAYGVLQAFNL